MNGCSSAGQSDSMSAILHMPRIMLMLLSVLDVEAEEEEEEEEGEVEMEGMASAMVLKYAWGGSDFEKGDEGWCAGEYVS